MVQKRNASASAVSAKAKARKVVDPVAEAVDSVCAAVELCPDSLPKDLIIETARQALPIVSEDRGPLHNVVLQWVREALNVRRAAIQAQQTNAQNTIASVDTRRATAMQAKDGAQATEDAKKAAHDATAAVLTAAITTAKEEAAKVKPIVKERNAAEAELKKMTDHLEYTYGLKNSLTTAFEKYDSGAKKAAGLVVAFLKQDSTADPALAVSAGCALDKDITKRTQFDLITIDYVSKFIGESAEATKGRMAEQNKKIAAICESMADNVAAQHSLDSAKAAEAHAAEELATASAALAAAEDGVDAVDREFVEAESSQAMLAVEMEILEKTEADYAMLVKRTNVPAEPEAPLEVPDAPTLPVQA